MRVTSINTATVLCWSVFLQTPGSKLSAGVDNDNVPDRRAKENRLACNTNDIKNYVLLRGVGTELEVGKDDAFPFGDSRCSWTVRCCSRLARLVFRCIGKLWSRPTR